MTDEVMKPLRRRMIEYMTIRKLAPKTQRDYLQRVKHFTAFLGRSPDTASFEDVRRYHFIWRQVARAFRPSTKASRHCGSSSGSRCGAPTSSTIPSSSRSHASCRSC